MLSLLFLAAILPDVRSCLASMNPETTTSTTTTTTTTTTTLPCPCMLPTTDTAPECNLQFFGTKAGVPTLRIQGSNDPANPCTGYMSGCSAYRIVNQKGCNRAVEMQDPAIELPLICKGGPTFLAPNDPIIKVDCCANCVGPIG